MVEKTSFPFLFSVFWVSQLPGLWKAVCFKPQIWQGVTSPVPTGECFVDDTSLY